MAMKTTTSTATRSKTSAQALKDAQRAYRRALAEAGISMDDLALLKELAAERSRSERPADRVTRVYLNADQPES